MTEESQQLEDALQPDEVWEDYKQKIAEDHVAGFFSTYWTDLEEVDVPESQYTGEFVRYTVSHAEHRPPSVYSGVVRPANSGDDAAIDEAFLRFIELAYEAKDTPVISYSQGDITSVNTIWTAGESNACVAVIEAGCAGYTDSNFTLVERHDGLLIRTSVQPTRRNQYKLREMFAHGFQGIVRNRLVDTPDSDLTETLGIAPNKE
jgi:hypothetical protein